ncbi:anti-sigma factor family protein [Paraburkholderia pallida]|uniref:Anti-sigma factor n=1 Tax=Paraburkholderia pallida TaxID=2547399 RepID=A0A4P7D3T2_9BURK|nr:anti-sigma factor [Paraburkholderia pallida]QBR03421.1 anti-sigma factor [Paraburkholderia pallida]
MNRKAVPITEDEIHAYVDGMLEGERREEIDCRVETDAHLAGRVSAYFSLNDLLHNRYDRVLHEPLPERLIPSLETTHAARGRWLEAANWPRFAGLAATLVVGIGIGAGAMLSPSGRAVALGGNDATPITRASFSGEEALARQSAIAYVTYAPMVSRPVEVGVDREQELVTWLSSRLGTDVHPPVLTHAGYELMGGRLLPGDDGPIAQFMYHNALGERVTLNISHRKIASNITAFKLYQDGSVNVFYWVDGSFGYAISGGIDRKALLDLSHAVYEQLTACGGPHS